MLEARLLYLGLEKPAHLIADHVPIIEIAPRPFHDLKIQEAFSKIPEYTHVILTSKSALKILIDYLPLFGYSLSNLQNKWMIPVGLSTGALCKKYHLNV